MSVVHGRRVISVSLFGDIPRYIVPAMSIARDAKLFYPGWEVLFFVNSTVRSSVRDELRSSGAALRFMDDSDEPNGMFWRFRAVGEPGVNWVIFRDADSALSNRESLAVEEWIRSGKSLHILRDHPFHDYNILAGMFGVRVTSVTSSLASLKSNSSEYAEDIRALTENFLPKIPVADRHVNDSLFDFQDNPIPFPGKPTISYVGEVALQPRSRKVLLRVVRIAALVGASFLGRKGIN